MKYMNADSGKNKSLDVFAERMNNLLLLIVRHEISRENNHLSRGVVTIPQIHVLGYLSQKKTCSMRDITSGLSMKNSTLTGIVDRLVIMGLARRFNCKEDRRVVHVTITKKGERILQGLDEDRKRTIKRIFGNISAKDRRAYIKILEKVAVSVHTQVEAMKGKRGRDS